MFLPSSCVVITIILRRLQHTVYLQLTLPGGGGGGVIFSMSAFVGGGLFKKEGSYFFNVVVSFLTQGNSDRIIANLSRFNRLRNERPIVHAMSPPGS